MKRILIVEDDQAIAERQKDYLQMSGYDVICAADGDEGCRLIQEEKFDLVILDLMLPGKDGFEILKEISDTKEIPVLIVSAKDEEIFKIKGLNLGADDYITKPFGMGELVARVNAHLKTYERFSQKQRAQNQNKVIQVREMCIRDSEYAEAARNVDRLKPDGKMVVNMQKIEPGTGTLGGMEYDGEAMKRSLSGALFVDGYELAEQAGSVRAINVVLLGAALGAGLLPFSETEIAGAMQTLIPERFLEMNLKALKLGCEYVK